jgi:hypothetical protein
MGDFNPVTAPSQFKKNRQLIVNNTSPEIKLRTVGDESVYSRPICIGKVEAFSIFTSEGNIDVEVSPNGIIWAKLGSITGAGLFKDQSFYNFVRTKVTLGNPEIWIYRKYATY